MSNLENHNPQVIRKVSKEVKDLTQEKLEGIKISVNESNLTDIQAVIDGPGKPSKPLDLNLEVLREKKKYSAFSRATLTQFGDTHKVFTFPSSMFDFSLEF